METPEVGSSAWVVHTINELSDGAKQHFKEKEYTASLDNYNKIEYLLTETCTNMDGYDGMLLDCFHRQARCLIAMEEMDAARKMLFKADMKFPGHAKTYFLAAMSYRDLHMYEKAHAVVKRSLTVDPDYKPAKKMMEEIEGILANMSQDQAAETENSTSKTSPWAVAAITAGVLAVAAYGVYRFFKA